MLQEEQFWNRALGGILALLFGLVLIAILLGMVQDQCLIGVGLSGIIGGLAFMVFRSDQLIAIYENYQGFQNLQRKNLEKALDHFNEAIECHPQLAMLYSNRAIVYNQQGKPDLALADCNKAIEFNPNLVEG
ncbi:MAG: tetratricopeptide repeat protein, partial [Anaerolineae bacterium]